MRIATWNVNGIRARLDFVRLWLEAERPDVAGIQELKIPDDGFPRETFAELGYVAHVHGQKSWNGVAVLVRDGLAAEVLQAGVPGQEDFGARLLTVRVAPGPGGSPLVFSSVYVPNGKRTDHEDFPRKLAWLDALAAHLPAHHDVDAPAVVGGDFNVVPAPLDSWNEKELAGRIFHTDEERKRFAAILEGGFVDLFRQARPEEQAFSWWDYRGGAFHRKQGLRIDFLLGTRPVAERLGAVAIQRDWRKKHDGLTASDHAPVVAEIG
jgi:exodeoxyribonuclease-3